MKAKFEVVLFNNEIVTTSTTCTADCECYIAGDISDKNDVC